MAREQQPLPPALLYSLLKALNPGRIAAGRSRTEAGIKADAAAKRAFQSVVEAAGKARSASQFERLIRDSTTANRAESHGAITELTVEYTKDGYTIIRVRFEDGTQTVVAYPTD
jgi:Tfp pilus assembly major pilin PilA